jgi:NAD(P)-dependent dehydrogenase (short-subunit alcohol dehydrogenase family)
MHALSGMKRRMSMFGALAKGAGAFVLKGVLKRDTLDRKVVVITGGSRGLGLALARRCLERGAKVALLARDADTLERAAGLLGAGDRLVTLPCDVSDAGDVRAAVALVEDRLGPVGVLMHVAGMIQVGPFETMRDEDYRSELETHLFGAMHAVDAVLPGMRARKRGRIVLVSSIGGKIAVPHLLPYSVSKFALSGYGEGLHAELARHGIWVTTVTPGLMRTGSPRNADFKGRAEREYAWFTVSDSLPFVTLSAPAAAKRIVRACERGEAELVLVPFGRTLLALRALAPNLFARLTSGVNRLLPNAAGPDPQARKGRDSESAWTRSPLTVLTRRAEPAHNQRPH